MVSPRRSRSAEQRSAEPRAAPASLPPPRSVSAPARQRPAPHRPPPAAPQRWGPGDHLSSLEQGLVAVCLGPFYPFPSIRNASAHEHSQKAPSPPGGGELRNGDVRSRPPPTHTPTGCAGVHQAAQLTGQENTPQQILKAVCKQWRDNKAIRTVNTGFSRTNHVRPTHVSFYDRAAALWIERSRSCPIFCL